MQLQQLSRPLEIKAVDESGKFSGYGSVFGVIDRQADVVETGAFSQTIKDHKGKGTMPAMLWAHDMKQPIGAFSVMREDSKGLYLEGQLALKTAKGAEAYELMQMKALNGLSIGFMTPDGGAKYDHRNQVTRIKRVDLWEVSLVSIPANPDAVISEVKAALESKTSLERFLRNAGMSRAQAKALIAGGYSVLNPRQADQELVASLGAKAKSLSANILKSIQ